MLRRRALEVWVGVFIVVSFVSMAFILFYATSYEGISRSSGYVLVGSFDDISGLHVRAPVRIAGVKIGEVKRISLNTKSFKADVHLYIDNSKLKLAEDSSLSVNTDGLLGAKFLSVSPGYGDELLEPGAHFVHTNSALILEKLLGSLIFNLSK